MYKIQVARVKLSNLISKSKLINTNQMSVHLFPVMHLYALHYNCFWQCIYLKIVYNVSSIDTKFKKQLWLTLFTDTVTSYFLNN